MIDPLFFSDADAFSAWLETHHDQDPEVWVLFHRTGSGKVSQTWSEAVDVALCFGWIDGLRKSAGDDSYTVRFTPRRRNSVWSSVNVKKVEALMKAGKMRPEGLELFNNRNDAGGYSSKTRSVELDPVYESRFKEHQAAWDRFMTFAWSYRRDSVWWVMSAKKEETRLRRLDTLISSSFQGQRVPVFRSKAAPVS